MNLNKENNSNFNNQYLFFENYQGINLNRIKNDLKIYFETTDQKIFLSNWRKNQGYIPDGFKFRTIKTIYGSVTFKRRTYKYWDKYRYRYIFLADKKLQIEKYLRVNNHLRFKILEQIATGKRQRDICDMFSYAKITTATIGNIIKSFELLQPLKIIFYENKEKIKINKCLYINMDETFIKLKNNNKLQKYRIRLITFHTGYNEKVSTKTRKVLANKKVYLQLLPINEKINTKIFINKVIMFAKQFYEDVDQKEIIIGGDGAWWIRQAHTYLPNAKYILDKFHAIRHLKQLFSQRNVSTYQNYQNSKNLFKLGAYQDLINYLQKQKISKIEKLQKTLIYFQNNSIGVINQNHNLNIGISIESDISHIIKWLLGYGSKTFNYKTFKNMILLQLAQINQLDLISYLKKEFHNTQDKIKQLYWTKNWFFLKS